MVGAQAGLASRGALLRWRDREPRAPVVLYPSVSSRQARKIAAHPGRDHALNGTVEAGTFTLANR